MTQFYRLQPAIPANNLAKAWDVDDDSLSLGDWPQGNTSWAELEFEYPLDTHIIHTLRTIAITIPLRDALTASDLTGFHVGTKPCKLTIASWAENPDEIRASLQPLYCLIITGTAMIDDFGLGTGRTRTPYISRAAADLIATIDPTIWEMSRLLEVDETGWPIGLVR